MGNEDTEAMTARNEEPEDNGGPVWGAVALGALIGLVVGGGLALLFAPKAGPELRADLGAAVDDLKDRAEQVIDDLQASTTDLVARSRTVLEQTRQNLARSVEAGKDAYREKKDELTAQLDA